MTVKVTGIQETINRKIKPIANMKSRGHRVAMDRVVLKIAEDNFEYPPATAANRPPTPFYIRGKGMQYKRGNNLKSEDLLHRWDTKISQATDRVRAVIVNTASYAGYVLGKKQSRFMARIGWPNIYKYVRSERRKLGDLYSRVLKKHLD